MIISPEIAPNHGKGQEIMGMIEKRLLKDGVSIRFDARIHRRKAVGLVGGWQSKTFKTEKEAAKWINKTEAKVDSGDNVSKSAEKITFQAAANQYIADARPTKKQTDKLGATKISDYEKRTVEMLANDWGRFAISEITNNKIQGWITEFLRTPVAFAKREKIHPYFKGGLTPEGTPRLYSESTVRRHYFIFKKVLGWSAMHNNFHLDQNLFTQLHVPSAWAGKRERRLEAGEEAKLMAGASKGYAHHEQWPLIIKFAIETTARMQEILLARWSDIDKNERSWNIPKEHVKTRKGRKVPLGSRTMAILQQMEAFKSPGDDRIFHQWLTSGTLSKAWVRLAKRSGIANMTFHDLRHEGVSRLFENTDLSDTEIMKITGHSSHEMLVGYAVLREKNLANRLDGVKRGS